MNTEENVAVDAASEEVTVKSEKKSNGQLFKEKHKYSLTMHKLMIKHKCSSLDEYRKLRNKKRKERRMK